MSFAHVVRHPQGGTRAGFQRRALSADFLFLNTPPPGPPGATPLLQGGSLGSYLRAEPACPVTSVGDGHVVGRAADMVHVFSFRGSGRLVSVARRAGTARVPIRWVPGAIPNEEWMGVADVRRRGWAPIGRVHPSSRAPTAP